MDTRETVAFRIRQLCAARKITPNGLANLSAVPQATIKSILNDESKNPGIVTIRKLCDGFARNLASVLLTFLVRGGAQAQLARLEVGDVKRHSCFIGVGMDDVLAAGAV